MSHIGAVAERDTTPARAAPRLAAAGAAGIAVSFGMARYGFGLFLPPMRAELALSPETAGLIGAGSYVGCLLALLTSWTLAPRVGPRPLVVGGTVLAAVGMAVTGLARSAPVLAVGIALAGSHVGWTWAAYNDAAHMMVRAHERSRVLSVISTGQIFGLAVMVPISFAVGPHWRVAWFVFSGIALVVAGWNARVLFSGPPPSSETDSARAAARTSTPTTPARSQAVRGRRDDRRRLWATAALFSLTVAVYWTFAGDLIATATGSGGARELLWLVISFSGTAGFATGDLQRRWGLRRIHTVATCALATAVALLGVAPADPAALVVSAVLYGVATMTLGAAFAVWSDTLFPDRPGLGLTHVVLILTLGQTIGAGSAGAAAAALGAPALFLSTGLFALLLLTVRPR